MSETETPPIITDESLVPTRTRGASMLDRWIATDPKQAIERVETMVKVLEQLRTASIRATYPSDWLIHVSRDPDGRIISERGYLQDMGAERAGKLWGIEVGNPAIEREDFPDGSYTYHMIAEAWSKVTGERLDYAEGSRWSGDRFFQRGGESPDPTDIRKAAYANLHGRAVRALSGLNGVPLDMLRQAGLDLTKVVIIDYQKGAQGGESAGARTGGGADVTVAFGKSAGKTPAELADADLDWYLKAYGQNVADPAKARFIKANQAVLDALTREKERRTQKNSHEEATGPEETKPGSRGQVLTDLRTRLMDACGKNGQLMSAVTRALSKETGPEVQSLSDLTDEQLAKLAGIDDTTLGKVVEGIRGKK